MASARDVQWDLLYNALIELLSRWGHNQDFKGPDDYLVVSDDWGGWTQKVEFVNPELPIDEIANAVQGLLATKFKRWNVIFVFSDGTDREGMRLFADRVVRESEDPDAK